MRNDNRKRRTRKATSAARRNQSQRGSHARSPAGTTSIDLEGLLVREVRTALNRAFEIEARRIRARDLFRSPSPFIVPGDGFDEHINCRCATAPDPEADMIDVAFLPEVPRLEAPRDDGA